MCADGDDGRCDRAGPAVAGNAAGSNRAAGSYEQLRADPAGPAARYDCA